MDVRDRRLFFDASARFVFDVSFAPALLILWFPLLLALETKPLALTAELVERPRAIARMSAPLARRRFAALKVFCIFAVRVTAEIHCVLQ
jgi:hypothetical protein